VFRRKSAGTLRLDARGRAAHAGSAPDQGTNALLALARAATALAALHDPGGPDRLSVVPTVIRSGEALNVVPASGELVLDMRADRLEAFEPVLAAVPAGKSTGHGSRCRFPARRDAFRQNRAMTSRAGSFRLAQLVESKMCASCSAISKASRRSFSKSSST